MQNNILAADPFGGFPHQFKLNCGRYLEPGFSSYHACRHIRTAHTGGKSSQCSIGTCMGIRSNDCISCNHQPLFRKKGMFDSHLSYIEIIGNFVFAGKITAAFTVFRGFNILIWNKVVHDQGNLIFMKDRIFIKFLHFLNGNRRCDIIPQYQIQFRFDQLACLYLGKPCMGCQYFLGHRHSHCLRPPVNLSPLQFKL